jgi:quinohemoprotein ethanol dehydrogenase
VAEKERWRIVDNGPAIRAAYGASIGGGTLATAGNLVFQGATAYNAQTGEKLWQSDLGGVNVTPVTYMLDGKQYVSLLGGPVTTSHLFTFVLDGKAPMPGAAVSTNAPANADPKTFVSRICSGCHALEVVPAPKWTATPGPTPSTIW